MLSLIIILAASAGGSRGQYEGDCSLIFYESFESLDGIAGNNGSYLDTKLVQAGWDGRGIMIDGNDTLSYSRYGSLDLNKGSIEMWVKPQWDGDDNETHFFFNYWVDSKAALSILKGETNNNLFFYIYHSKIGNPDNAVGYWVGDWNANEWHHIAATWRTDTANSDFLRLYIDRKLVAELAGQDFPQLNSSSELFNIGYVDYGWIQQYRADSVIDELMIFNHVIDYEQPAPGFDDSFDGYPFGAVPASIVYGIWVNYSLAVEAGITETGGAVVWGDIEKTKGVYSWDDNQDAEHLGLFDTYILNAQSRNISVNQVTIQARRPYYMDCRNSSCPSEKYPTAEVGCLYEEENRNDFKKFVYNAVERYDGDGVCDVPGLQEGIRTWRYGTEMGAGTWCGTGQDFLVAYEDLYHAVKSADPNARLIFGGLHDGILGCIADYQCSDWILQNARESVELFDYIYSNIDSQHVDAFGLHPYDKWHYTPERIDAMNDYLAGKGLDSKPLWVIEDGEIIAHELITPESDKRQAEEVVKRFVISMSRGIEHINWCDLYWYHGCLNVNCSCALGDPHPYCEPAPCCYGQDDAGNYVRCPMLEECEECAFAKYHCYGSGTTYNDPCGGQCIGTKNGDHENMALLEYDELEAQYKKRPGFYTYRLMTEKLGGYDSVEIISEDNYAYYGYKFMVRGNPVWVLWANQSQYSLDLNTNSDVLITHIITQRGITEPVSEIRSQSNVSGYVRIAMNETPLFVEEYEIARNSGDINGDKVVDIQDFSLVALNMGKTGSQINPPEADQTGDAIVDIFDLVVVGRSFGNNYT